MSEFLNMLKNLPPSGMKSRNPKLVAGTHRLALVSVSTAKTRMYGNQARFMTFVVLESDTLPVNSLIDQSWFIDAPEQDRAQRARQKYRDFLAALSNSTADETLAEWDEAIRGPAQPGRGVQIVAECTAQTQPRPYTQVNWRSVSQTQEQIKATREVCDRAIVAPVAAPPATPPAATAAPTTAPAAPLLSGLFNR